MLVERNEEITNKGIKYEQLPTFPVVLEQLRFVVHVTKVLNVLSDQVGETEIVRIQTAWRVWKIEKDNLFIIFKIQARK